MSRRWRWLLPVALGAVLALPAVPAAPGPAWAAADWPPSTDVLIGEVVTGGTSGSDEYVELYNRSDLAVQLDGLELVYVTASGGTVTTKRRWSDRKLRPGGHLLVANADGSFAALADDTYTNGLSATGGSIVLRVEGGGVIDSLSWGTAASSFVEGTPGTAPRAGWSLERRPGGLDGNGRDTNDNAADTLVNEMPIPEASSAGPQPTPEPTPKPTPEPTPHTRPPSPPRADPATRADRDPTPSPRLSPRRANRGADSDVDTRAHARLHGHAFTRSHDDAHGHGRTHSDAGFHRHPDRDTHGHADGHPDTEAHPLTPTPKPTATPDRRHPSPTPTADTRPRRRSPPPRPTATPTAAPSVTIAVARGLAVGARPTVTGVVTAEPGRILGARTLFIQDGSGGIAVRLPDELPPRRGPARPYRAGPGRARGTLREPGAAPGHDSRHRGPRQRRPP